MRIDFLKIKYINVVLAFSRNKKDFYPNAKFFILFILFFLGGSIREHAKLVVQSELGSPSDGRGGAQFD